MKHWSDPDEAGLLRECDIMCVCFIKKEGKKGKKIHQMP